MNGMTSPSVMSDGLKTAPLSTAASSLDEQDDDDDILSNSVLHLSNSYWYGTLSIVILSYTYQTSEKTEIEYKY